MSDVEAEEIKDDLIKLQTQQTKAMKTQTWFIFLSVLIASLIGYHTILLINKQLDSISPLKPEIHILIDDENELIYSIEAITREYYNERGELLFPWQSLKIVIQNIGRMDSGQIISKLGNESIIVCPKKMLNNIPGESSVKINFNEFWFADCRKVYLEENNECEKISLNPGVNQLTIETECEYCNKKKIIRYVDICLWETEEDCEEFRKSYHRVLS